MSAKAAALRAVETALQYIPPQIVNGTAMPVMLLQSTPEGTVSGSGRIGEEFSSYLAASPADEVALEAGGEPLEKLDVSRQSIRVYAAPVGNTWQSVLCTHGANHPVLVRPEVGAALAAGAVADTRALDGIVFLVPLNYSIEQRGQPLKATLVVRSLYAWWRDADDASRKRTRTASQ